MTTFRWLHLTDLHLGMLGQKSLWPNVEEAFLEDLELLREKVGPWNLVLFTGDLTQRGSKAEFEAVEKLFQKFWERFKEWGFEPELLAIPGNHDLIRPEDRADPTLLTLLHNWHLPEVQESFWEKEDSPQRRLISSAFQPFTEWWESTGIPKPASLKSGLLPGDCSATFLVDGFSVGVVGLNSACLQLAGGDFEGRLHLDARQLHKVCDDHAADWTKQHDACLLLTHHPAEWLTKESERHFSDEIYCPPDRFALHLFGHMHEGGLTSLAYGGGKERRKLQGCSLFGLENWGEKEGKRKHGYSLGEFKLEDNELRLRIWPRNAFEKPGGGRTLERDVHCFELDKGKDDGGTKPIVVKQMAAKGVAAASHVVPSPPPSRAAEQYDPRHPPFYVPYRQKGGQVIGREESLKKVRQQLVAGRRTAIGQTAVFQGFGGLGKTQLAVEYAYLYREEYPHGVIWLTADQDIDAQLVDLAVKAHWVAPELDHAHKLDIARRRLRRYSDCLIVFDNLEQMSAIKNYLPEPPAGPHILATSRNEQPEFVYVPIDVLNPEESLRLLIQESGREPETEADWESAKRIVERLEGLPLAIELAGAYLARRPVHLRDYLDLLERNFRKALPPRLASLTGHTADLYSTLQISQQVFAEEPLLGDILDVLTWSASATMSLELLASLLGVEDRTELIGAIGLGRALRILQNPPGSDRYGIHRLVREVRREEIQLGDKANWAAEMCQRIAIWFGRLLENFSHLPRFEADIEHLREWHQHSLKWAPNLSSRLTWLQAYPAIHRAQPQEIKRLIEVALEEYQQRECDDRELLANLYNDLAHSLHLLGNPKRALELGQQALTIRRELFGEFHTETAKSFANIASCYNELGNTKRALELGEQALAIRSKLHGEWHPETARSFNNNAAYYHALGDTKRAIELTEKSLGIRRKEYGDNHPDTANCIHNLAFYENEIGNTKRALELAEVALTIRRKLFGDEHSDTATLLNCMAAYYHTLGDSDKALEVAKQGLAIRRELFGEMHPDVANSLHNIAWLLYSRGKTLQLRQFALDAYRIRKKVLGENHQATLKTLNLLRNIPGFRMPITQRTSGGTKTLK